MGLDMYAYSVPMDKVISDTEILFGEDEDRDWQEEIYYWRKHHDLHGWMERLWLEKRDKNAPSHDVFNCIPVRLSKEDLDNLEKDVVAGKLPATTGFFFGNYPPDKESQNRDLEFIQKARTEIAKGRAVYYNSWW